MQTLAILQARCSSSRLPNKVMLPLLGEPMLMRQIERISRAKSIDSLLVATSTDTSDDALAQLCEENGVAYHRGSLDDVLDRFYQASKNLNPAHVVRLTGDCPLADPEVIDKVVEEYLEVGSDYASNALAPTYPDGLDVEIFRFSALEAAWRKAQLSSEREHVTPFIHKNPEVFQIHHVRAEQDFSHLRWTVDNQEDFVLIEKIYSALYFSNPSFTSADVLNLIRDQPELATINTHIIRNEGYAISLARDAGIKFKLGEK